MKNCCHLPAVNILTVSEVVNYDISIGIDLFNFGNEKPCLVRQTLKNITAYKYIDEMLETVRQTGDLPVPLHLRNAPTELMKGMGYGKEYKYPHDYPGHWVEQDYLPEEMLNKK